MRTKEMYGMTATERIKTFAPAGLQFMDLGDLRGFMTAKGFDLNVVARLAEDRFFGRLFSELVLRVENPDTELLDQYGTALGSIAVSKSQPYTGCDSQNSRIDTALANSGISSGPRRFGEGSATFFNYQPPIPESIQSVPIAVIGYGAAGIMVSFALRSLGFMNVDVFEKSAPLGIWGYENVNKLSRNNPVRLEFFGKLLESAPGSGIEVRDFLRHFEIRSRKAEVRGIQPGNLRHKIMFAAGKPAQYPIVINAVGLGKPKPVSDPARMVTQTGSQHAGARWQQRLEAEKIVGKRIVLIGLGNSTAEMLQQIHSIIDAGYEVDYRVITHYPEDAVRNPNRYVASEGKTYRVFRDISRPNLVDYQGDLPHSRRDYFRALHGGKIIPDVKRWEVETPGVMTVFGPSKERVLYDKIMTLIGYHQGEENMSALGCLYDPKGKCGVFDYDGEYVAMEGQRNAVKRLHKGCFGFGSVLETPFNPNAIVIPGMLHRIGDLLFGVIMRAAEFRKKQL